MSIDDEFNSSYESPTLTICDTGLIATLKYFGKNPTSIECSSRTVSFNFSKTAEIEAIINSYELGQERLIDPCKLIESFRNVKGLIFRTLQKRNPGKVDYGK
jgi:hypothetical protein